MQSPPQIRLFVKPGCPWCDEAESWLEERHWRFERLDVTRNRAAREEMFALTGQTRAPSLEADGRILADFGAEELEAWWRDQGWPLESK